MDGTSVWIVSPAWRRFAVTRLALAQRQHLAGELSARGLDVHSLIVADDENLEIAEEYGAVALEAPNKPLGAKINRGIEHACREGADWLVWIGSDDWVHPDVFDPLENHAAQSRTRPILNGNCLAVVCLQTGRLRRLRSPSLFGAIPWIVPRQLLQYADWQPLPNKSQRGLDGALIRGLRKARAKPRFEPHNPHGLRCVDFKSDTNLNSYQSLGRSLAIAPEEDAWSALAEHYPAELVGMARDLHLNP